MIKQSIRLFIFFLKLVLTNVSADDILYISTDDISGGDL